MTHFVFCSGKLVTLGPATYVSLLGHVDLRPPPLGFAEKVVQTRTTDSTTEETVLASARAVALRRYCLIVAGLRPRSGMEQHPDRD